MDARTPMILQQPGFMPTVMASGQPAMGQPIMAFPNARQPAMGQPIMAIPMAQVQPVVAVAQVQPAIAIAQAMAQPPVAIARAVPVQPEISKRSSMPAGTGPMWRPDAMCDGLTAKEHADYLVSNKGVTESEARMQVIREFPTVFNE